MATSNKRSAVGYSVVVSCEWNGGTRRYSDRTISIPFAGNPDVGVAGRVVQMSSFTLAVDAVSDSATITLDNTGFGGGGTIESNWSDAHPPEGTSVEISYCFDGDDWADRTILIYGSIAEVHNMSDRELDLIIHGFDANLPEQVNVEINLTDFPGAPRASVGLMQPLVFGTPVRMEGIPVTTIASTQTTASGLAADTSIPVGDVTQLPTSGTILLGGAEKIAYTGITGNTLTGCTRGTSSTTAQDFAAGVTVVTSGELDILVAGHDVTSIDKVWGVSGNAIAPLDSGLYTAQLTQPALIKFAAGWPTIPVPAGKLDVQQLQMDSVTASDTSVNGIAACGNVSTWSNLDSATISKDNLILDTKRTSAVVPNGQILRVLAVVEFQEAPFPLSGGDTVGVSVSGGAPLGDLAAGQSLEVALLDLVGLGLVRVNDSVHTHTTGTVITINLRHDVDASVVPSVSFDTATAWNTGGGNPISNVKDGSNATYALSSDRNTSGWSDGMDLGSVNVTNFGTYSGQSGKTPTRIRAHCRYGQTTGTPPYYTDDAWLNLNISGVLKKQVRMAGTEASYGVDLTTDWYSTTSWTDVADVTIEVDHIPGTTLWGQNITEVWLEVEYSSTTSTSDPTQAAVYTSGMAFDITSTVAGAWSWFTNATIRCTYSGTHAQNVRIARCYFLIENTAFIAKPCDRILADVEGFASGGLPTDVLLSALDVVGMHLKRNSVDFAAAAAALGTFRQDFVVYQAISGAALIQMICDEARLRCFWEDGLLCVVYLPDLSDLVAGTSQWGDNDAKDELPVITRTPLSDTYTLWNATYNYDGFVKTEAKALVKAEAVALSTRRKTMKLMTLADTTSAASLLASKAERAATPRYSVQVTMFLSALSIRRGSIIQAMMGRRRYTKVEVMQLTIQDGWVTALGTVWDTIT